MKLEPTIKLNVYEILSRAVESGVGYGYRRAHKHTNRPTEDVITQEIYNAVMNELFEVLVYNDDEGYGSSNETGR